MRYYIAGEEQIDAGKITDIYFVRTKKIVEAKGLKDVRVRMEVHTGSLPRGYGWAVFAGLEEALKLLSNRDINVFAVPEGTLITPNFPVMIVEGRYYDICELETALLGILRHYTSVATAAARIKRLAMDKTVLYFGLRGAHPAIAPMLDRAAYIGGVDAVSGAFNPEYTGLIPVGTMPHALMLVFGDNVKAWKAFDEVVEEGVPRIFLIDTFNDERVEAVQAIRELGERVWGLRLDTPKSRRGDMRLLIEEIRWTLHLMGRDDVRIVVSGGIGERTVRELREVVDAFGVGTSITYPRPVDMSMDIVEKLVDGEWVPYTKRGKLPGARKVYRCGALDYEITHWAEKPRRCSEELTKQWLANGKLVRELPSLRNIHEYVIEQLRSIPEPEPA